MSGFTPRYGLGYDQLKDDFPQLIYCSITGFGHSGPYSKRPAYDMLIQASCAGLDECADVNRCGSNPALKSWEQGSAFAWPSSKFVQQELFKPYAYFRLPCPLQCGNDPLIAHVDPKGLDDSVWSRIKREMRDS